MNERTLPNDLLSMAAINNLAIQDRFKKDKNPVIGVCESLAQYIQDFENSLNPDQEVGARLVTFGQAITFHIDKVGFSKPNIVTFYGTTDNDEQVQLIQHVSQLSVLLIAMKKIRPERRQIGFVWEESQAE